MKERQTKTIEANGLTFTYDEQGEGSLVLCIHGFPDTRTTWHETLEALAKAGFRAVAPQLPGSALSRTDCLRDGSFYRRERAFGLR